MRKHKHRLASLLAFAPTAIAQLPYNPRQLLLSPDGTTVYDFQPQGSLRTLDVSGNVAASGGDAPTQSLPFTFNGSVAYSVVADADGMSILAGNCQDQTQAAQLWRISYDSGIKPENWKKEEASSTDNTTQAYFLSAGFSFSTSGTGNDAGLYYFGGMCPNEDSDVSNWTSEADYSNTMLSALPDSSQKYKVDGKLSPPVAEAGLTITPLSQIVSNSSDGKVSQTQNFVLLGGHTATAFINMSQVAIYSLPNGAWTFKGVNQPDGAQGELIKRSDSMVEPRSGHTAVLSDDRTKIIVLGGWVGDITNPAIPQLAILEIGDEYGTSNSWSWNIPSQDGSPFTSTSGIFGHGAVMLPGNVMMISGGNAITKSKVKRDSTNYYFYNITSSTWQTAYDNPGTGEKGRSHSSKAGLGAGLGVGLAAVAGLAIFAYLFARKKKQQRIERERRLRAMALGSGKNNSESQISGVVGHSSMRSASWGNAEEKQIESSGRPLPWLPNTAYSQSDPFDDMRDAERTGLDVHAPSPTRGLRRNLHSKGPAGFGNHFQPAPTGPGAVFRIDEEEEERSIRSGRPVTAASRHSDPFKDPPELGALDPAAAERKKEVKGWMEDWQSAGISLSRNTSQARTYSNLSQTQSVANSNSDRGRMSPDKSDRTNSNLSDRSTLSNSSTQSHPARTLSHRSASAGLALFAGAAAAMSRFAGGEKTELDRSASKRSVSMRGPYEAGRPPNMDNQIQSRNPSPTKSEAGLYFTPPESPIKDYKNYTRPANLTSRVRARGVLGSMKRVFTGTSQVDVDAKVEHYEEKEKEAGGDSPEMGQTPGHGSAIPFWQGQKGAKDWEPDSQQAGTSLIRRRSGGQDHVRHDQSEPDGDDWDIETAIQHRVVQVMFTVPKEKLRVVNADTLSLISRSDVGDRDEDRDLEVQRMSSVHEENEFEPPNKGKFRREV